MTPSRFDRFLPLAGVLAGLTFTAFNLMTWGAPETTDAHEPRSGALRTRPGPRSAR